MEIDEGSLIKLKTGSDKRMREIFESALVKSNLARNLAWAVAILAAGVMYVTSWVISIQNSTEKLKEGQKENRGYIRDLWNKTYNQPLPPPSAELESRLFDQLKIQSEILRSQQQPITGGTLKRDRP